MARFVEELTRAGVLLATGGLDRGTHVTASGENVTFTDGPFTESKEVIVSFALIEVCSAEEPLELACANTGASSRAARIESPELGLVFCWDPGGHPVARSCHEA